MNSVGCDTVFVYSLVDVTLLNVCRCTPFVVCERSVQLYLSKEGIPVVRGCQGGLHLTERSLIRKTDFDTVGENWQMVEGCMNVAFVFTGLVSSIAVTRPRHTTQHPPTHSITCHTDNPPQPPHTTTHP
ncbi:hypothetical protein J6590_085594 [Homalodisca vitripennis]|nr:hypothetical protein J6590_085594 [Homalodisca vitripennis]